MWKRIFWRLGCFFMRRSGVLYPTLPSPSLPVVVIWPIDQGRPRPHREWNFFKHHLPACLQSTPRQGAKFSFREICIWSTYSPYAQLWQLPTLWKYFALFPSNSWVLHFPFLPPCPVLVSRVLSVPRPLAWTLKTRGKGFMSTGQSQKKYIATIYFELK